MLFVNSGKSCERKLGEKRERVQQERRRESSFPLFYISRTILRASSGNSGEMLWKTFVKKLRRILGDTTYTRCKPSISQRSPENILAASLTQFLWVIAWSLIVYNVFIAKRRIWMAKYNWLGINSSISICFLRDKTMNTSQIDYEPIIFMSVTFFAGCLVGQNTMQSTSIHIL